MDDKAFVTKQSFQKLMFQEGFPSGYELITTSESGDFNPEVICGGSTSSCNYWGHYDGTTFKPGCSEITVVNSNSVAANGTFKLKAPNGNYSELFVSSKSTRQVDYQPAILFPDANITTNDNTLTYYSGLKISSTTTKLYKWIKK